MVCPLGKNIGTHHLWPDTLPPMALAYTATARLTDPHQELRVDGLNFQTLEWTR